MVQFNLRVKSLNPTNVYSFQSIFQVWYAIKQKHVFDITATQAITVLHQEKEKAGGVPHAGLNRLFIDTSRKDLSNGFKVRYGSVEGMHYILTPTSKLFRRKMLRRRSKSTIL